MSRLLEQAATLDSERAASLAANDAAMSDQLRTLKTFLVKVKCGAAVRLAFEAMGLDSCSVTAQHCDLASAGEYLTVGPA